jgi:hypothetical protein
MRPSTGLILAALAFPGCSAPALMPPPPMASIALSDAMLQAVGALAATRAEAARQGLRACGAEAVFQVMPVAVPAAHGQPVGQLVLAPPDSQEGPLSSTVTLTLAGDGCDAPEPAPRPRR